MSSEVVATDFRRRRFRHVRTLAAMVEAERGAVARELPDPVEATSGTVRVVVGRWDDEVVGVHQGGAVYVPARIGDLAGEYILRMYVDSDRSLIVGREVYGEPKLLGRAGLRREGRRCGGWATREDSTLVVDGELTEQAAPSRGSRRSFNLKAHLRSDMSGLVERPLITVTAWTIRPASVEHGRGDVAFTGTFLRQVLGRSSARAVPLTWSEGSAEGWTDDAGVADAAQALALAYRRLGLDD